MARTIAESLEILESSRSEIRTALTEKKVETAESLKISQVADEIRKIDSYSFTFIITASSTYYDGVTFTARHTDGDTYTGVMQSGECRITVGKPGEYTITNDLTSSSFRMNAVKEDDYSVSDTPSASISKSSGSNYTINFSNIKDTVTKKITVTKNSESGSPLEGSYYSVGGSGNSYTVTFNKPPTGTYYINAFYTLKGKDIKLGSLSATIAPAEVINMKAGRIPTNSKITAIISTDQKAPGSTSTTDLSAAGNNGVVGWVDGTTYYISTQKSGALIGVTDGSNLFESSYKRTEIEGSYMTNYNGIVETIDLSYMDFSKCTTLESAFYQNDHLTEIIGINSIDTSQVKSLRSTFEECNELTSLDIGSWNTQNVTDMYHTFNLCSGLTSLNVSSWKVGSVTTLDSTFSACSSLASLDVSSWDVGNVTSLFSTFSSCGKLTSLDIESWNTKSVKTVSQLVNSSFSEDSQVSLDLSGWDTSNITDISSMFAFSNITEVNLNNWDVANMQCDSKWDVQSVFRKCSKLKTIHAEDWTGNSYVIQSSDMFEDCTSLVGGISYDSSKKSGAYAKRNGGYFSA